MADEKIKIIEEVDEIAGDKAAATAEKSASELVIDSAPGFAMGSLMIGASQAQTRAMETGVIALGQHYTVGLATSAQSASKVLGIQSEQLQEFMATLQAAQNN